MRNQKHSLHLTRAALAFTFVASLASCTTDTQPITPQTVSTDLRAQLDLHLNNSTGLITQLVAGDFVSAIYREGCELADGAESSCEIPWRMDEEEVEEIIEAILELGFDDTRIVERTETEIIYAPDFASLCEEDAQCAADVNRLNVQLIVSAPSPGAIAIALRVAGHSMGALTLNEDEISMELDLAQIHAAILAQPDVFDLDADEIPSQMLGRVRLALTQNTVQRYTASLSVLSQTTIQGGEITLSVAPSDGVAVSIDGSTESAIAAVSLGAMSLSAPARLIHELFSEEALELGASRYDFMIGGLSANLSLSETEDKLELRNVGLGQAQSQWLLDGAQVLGVDLNRSAGRAVDVTIGMQDDALSATFSPSFSLELIAAMQPLIDRGVSLPAWTGAETSSVELSGATLPALTMGFDEERAAIRVDAGQLEFKSSSRPALVVPAGDCVFVGARIDDAAHPFEALQSGACP